MNTTLDPFQTRLLAELREVVAAGDVQPVRTPPRRRRAVVLGAVAATTVAGVVVAPGLLGSDPAYAVVPGANGVVDVTVNRLADSEGLERALARAGVRSDITYLPEGQTCAGGRYADAVAPDPDAIGSFEFRADGYRIQLEPGAIADDQTIVIDAARVEPGGVHAQFGVAQGPVAPCRPVPVTAPSGPSAGG